MRAFSFLILSLAFTGAAHGADKPKFTKLSAIMSGKHAKRSGAGHSAKRSKRKQRYMGQVPVDETDLGFIEQVLEMVPERPQ